MSTTEMDISKTTTPAPATPVTKVGNWRRPRYDVSENDEGFRVRVSLPGVNRAGVDISYEDDTLRITERVAVAPAGWRPLHRDGRGRLSPAPAPQRGCRGGKIAAHRGWYPRSELPNEQ